MSFSTIYSLLLNESKSHLTWMPSASLMLRSSSSLITDSRRECRSRQRRYRVMISLRIRVGCDRYIFTSLHLNNSSAMGLSCGFSSRQRATASLRAGEYSRPSNRGGVSFRINCIAHRASLSQYGGFPVASSYKVIPRDHISALTL